MRQSVFAKAYMALVLILMYVPMLLVIIYSFNSSKLSTLWGGFSFEWYAKLFQNTQMAEALKNSLIIATLTSLISGIVGTAAAVSIFKSRALFNKVAGKLATVPLMMPEIITGLVFLLAFSYLGVRLGVGSIVIAHSSFCIPYVYMTVSGSLDGFDITTKEAARDLGAGSVRTFFEIVVPQLLPASISGMLLSFAMSMDDVIISFFVTGPATNTLPVKIYSQMRKGVTPEINALCSLMLVVTIALVIGSRLLRNKKTGSQQTA